MFDIKDKLEVIAWASAVVLYVANEIRKWWSGRKRKKSTIDMDVDIHFKIDSILYQMLMIYDACRVMVVQFHNGDEYYTGQSRIRMTVTNEVVFPGVKKVAQDYTGVQVPQYMHNLMRDIRVFDYKYVQSKEDAEKWVIGLGDIMNDLDMKSLMLIRLADTKSGETVAILSIHFPHEKALNREHITTLMRSKNRLETIFDRL